MKFYNLILLVSILKFASANVEISPAITNGNNATVGQFPYFVSFQDQRLRGSHGCGGGILNERWVLSAAHCFWFTQSIDDVLMVVGTVLQSEGGDEYRIEVLHLHPDFIPNFYPYYMSNFYDIAVMKSKTRIVFGELVQPIPLNRNFVSENTPATMAGFGVFDSNTTIWITPPVEMAEHLQYMDTKILSHAECVFRTTAFNFVGKDYPYWFMIHPTSHICSLQPSSGLCFGDSGSMLISNGEAIGVVVSGVRLCGQHDEAPDIYTRISTFIDWIDEYIHDLD